MMTTWFHSTIIATSLAACAAVGLASASMYSGVGDGSAMKTDRLEVTSNSAVTGYRTIETRMDGISVLSRVPASEAN
jgi:hypothetical protein